MKKSEVKTLATLETLANIIESIVFVSGNQISVKDIAEKLEVSEKQVLEAANKLQEKYGENSGINLLVFNKKLQFCSNPKYAEDVAVVLNPIRERELSKSMLEVAAIIAYKQPVTRLDLEEIRGVDSEYAIQNLLKLGVIEVVGRKDAIGRPVLFGTTDGFLKRFQIPSLDALPDYDKLLSAIASTNKDSYLFRKDEYDESKDPEYNASVEQASMAELNAFNDQNNEGLLLDDASNDDFELGDISDEEIPDFLQGEKLTKIN